MYVLFQHECIIHITNIHLIATALSVIVSLLITTPSAFFTSGASAIASSDSSFIISSLNSSFFPPTNCSKCALDFNKSSVRTCPVSAFQNFSGTFSGRCGIVSRETF